jgi:ribosomal protein S18 acetylase RimI-like enzyme
MTIRPFDEQRDREAFRTLNEEWISRFFVMEEQDRLVLGDPKSHILDPGGRILMAYDDEGERAIGCCALIPCHVHEGVLELAKLAVSPELRGKGLGRKILDATLAEARAMGARAVRLETSTSLANAVRLYESAGFRHVPPEPSPFSRANVFMELPL